ncbi:MAG TPA: hypothetical protein VFH85_01190 [Gammaproteobacteria bacterium]|nr:hypothetical protein [Gammaproteobacteria bacterium]
MPTFPKTESKKMNAREYQQFLESSQVKKEEEKNIGNILPDSVTALDKHGNEVSLKSLLHGPAVVVKTIEGCEPCSWLDSYIEQHGDDYIADNGVQIVVLYTGSPADPDASDYPRNMPPQVTVLHHPGFMFNGFLGGANVPAVYFFNGKLELVRAREGVSGSVESLLKYPRSTQTGHKS